MCKNCKNKYIVQIPLDGISWKNPFFYNSKIKFLTNNECSFDNLIF